MTAPRMILLAAAAASVLSGCQGCQKGGGDAGPPADPLPVPAPDSGPSPIADSGPIPDAGPAFTGNHAGEACAPELMEAPDDGGAPDGSIRFGLCVVLRVLSGTATLNAGPAANLELEFESGEARGDITRHPDGVGHYEARVMRSRYDALRYHPSGIFPTHQGPEDFGLIDLRRDQVKDLAVRSWSLRGNLSFAGVPWAPSTTPPDVQVGALGFPPSQAVAATSQTGTYEVALLEGTFSLGVSVPLAALGETEIIGWPVSLVTVLTGDASLDVNIPASQFSGSLTLDGEAFPDRRAGFDYTFEYVSPDAQSAVARTSHEGGVSGFHALLPKNRYRVRLNFDSPADPHLPATLYDKQLAVSVDLTRDAVANFALTTFDIEGALEVDGVAARPEPNHRLFLYASAFGSANEPPFLAYYDVPLESSTFSLRAFPATYFLALYLDENFRPGMAEGWYIVEQRFEVTRDRQMPVHIWTSPLEGRFTVDGEPPPPGKPAGILTLSGAEGFYRQRLMTEEDGSFHLRVPRGTYDVFFEIDPATFPGYATGRQLMLGSVPLEDPQFASLDYQTLPVSGPIRVGGERVPDTFPGRDEVGLVMRRQGDGAQFAWGFGAGSPNYLLRVPPGDYQLTFRIEPEALPGVAHGHAPLGVKLVVR